MYVHMFQHGSNSIQIQTAVSEFDSPTSKTLMANFKTVCSYFRDQLNNLINMLMSTEPSFIRCIVPNNHKKPGVVDPFLVRASESSAFFSQFMQLLHLFSFFLNRSFHRSCTNLLAMECLKESEFVGRVILTGSSTMVRSFVGRARS